MTQEKFNDVVGSQIEFCKSMLIKKGTEYAPENHAPGEMDRLAHFKKAAVMMNCTPKVALVGMLSKHLVSVVDMCLSDRVYSKKQWAEKLTDSINYLMILRAIVEEELDEKNRSEDSESGVH